MFCACREDEGKVSKSWPWRLSWKILNMHPLFTKFISNLKYAVSCCLTSKENLKKWYCRHFCELLLKTYFSGIMLVATLKKKVWFKELSHWIYLQSKRQLKSKVRKRFLIPQKSKWYFGIFVLNGSRYNIPELRWRPTFKKGVTPLSQSV